MRVIVQCSSAAAATAGDNTEFANCRKWNYNAQNQIVCKTAQDHGCKKNLLDGRGHKATNTAMANICLGTLLVAESVISKYRLVWNIQNSSNFSSNIVVVSKYTVSPKKHVTIFFCNNFNSKCPITIIFGTVISKSMCHRKMVSLPTSPI